MIYHYRCKRCTSTFIGRKPSGGSIVEIKLDTHECNPPDEYGIAELIGFDMVDSNDD